jgi:hypothetical protein
MTRYIFLISVLFFLKCKVRQDQKVPVSKETLLSNQILLTNYATFRDHNKPMLGASAFLLNYRNKIFAVTAKHLLGDAMGIDPEIKTTELNKYLIKWQMFPRTPINLLLDTITIKRSDLDYTQQDKDILLLEIENTKHHIFPLSPTFKLPIAGEQFSIIGCPYIEDSCKQKSYDIVYRAFDPETSMLIFTIDAELDFSGFSGAPIIDKTGSVIAVLTSGWSDNGVNYIGGTYIKELEKIQ